jgi:dTDP-4-amino-4,6-dideoxygalactose transaminase
MSEEAHDNLAPVLSSGYIGQGPKVEEFEVKLRDFIKSPYVNTLNSGTSGLHLALHMLKHSESSSRKDEILTTPLTCTATNWPILATGLRIKWVDVDPNTCNVDLVDLERKITDKTLGIMVVHWGGYPCDLHELRQIQLRAHHRFGYTPPIIEDCAHALGATFREMPIGSHGNYCMFSFQAIKHLTTGDGGMLICPDSQSHKRAKLLRWYGLDRTTSADFRCEQTIQEWGYKFQMNDIAASIGLSNMEHLGEITSKHISNGTFYDIQLKDANGVRLLESKNDRQSSYWIYTMRVDNRDGFIQKMKEKGIGISRVHDRNDKHDCVQEFRTALPGTDKICKDMICIPCGWWVGREEREYIVESIKRGW